MIEMTKRIRTDRAQGSMLGLAIGDAIGAPTEFTPIEKLKRRHRNPTYLPMPQRMRVTDDTQMALAVGDGIIDADRILPDPDAYADAWSARFVQWADAVEKFRAPGLTCLKACDQLKHGRSWVNASVINSKGCGANMRVTPIGLIPDLTMDTLAGMAQLQSALTHGHPTALAASELTAYAVRLLVDGVPITQLPAALLVRCLEQRDTYHHEWLYQLWRRSDASNSMAFIQHGWDECTAALVRLQHALTRPYRESVDPCSLTGDAWIAEEALTTSLYCAITFASNPVMAVKRAAFTTGDSDSIAALTGAFVGAVHGTSAWPQAWRRKIEYSSRLYRMGADLTGR
jgi:ADP-ribosylglycohydrolase